MMAGQGYSTWRNGYDGLLAAVMLRLALDWRATSRIAPVDARKLAGVKSDSLTVNCCKFAVESGFRSPAQEMVAFLGSEGLASLLDLCGTDPTKIARRMLCQVS